MKHLFSMSNFFLKKTPQQVVQWARQNGFEGVELWADEPFLNIYRTGEETLEVLAKEQKELVYTVHAPLYDINICSVNTGIMKESVRQIKKVTGWSDYIKVKRIVVHPGKTPSRDYQVIKEVEKIFKKAIEEIKKAAFSRSIDLVLENITADDANMGRTPEELKKILDEFDLGLCLDTGHVNLCWDAPRTLKKMAKYIRQIHINDNNGVKDEHLPVGEGKIDWEIYKDIIKKGKVDIVHEIYNIKKPEEATILSRNNLERIIGIVSRETI